ncbi:MAG TPA: DUF5666 domain-containing protein [Candidatus Binatia bacterium]|nr:DUF5666 domain-containing protein [Candidatus Binatia bacterium]
MSDEHKKGSGMNRTAVIAAITGLVLGGAGFFGGMTYAKTQGADARRGGFANFQNLSPEERQQRIAQFGGQGGQGGNRMMRGGAQGGFVGGEILSADDKSITVKMRDGSTKIVLLSDSTEVTKSVAGTSADLAVGKNVMVIGKPNPDGSVTAQNVQLRPEGQGMMFFGGPGAGGPNGGPQGGTQQVPPPPQQ